MKQFKLKTNINCGSCVATVTPALNETAGVNNWEVDTLNSEKVLTVRGEAITPEMIEEALRAVGYKATVVI